MVGNGVRVNPVGEPTGTVACPTCGAGLDQCVCYESEAFCMECGEVFPLRQSGQGTKK